MLEPQFAVRPVVLLEWLHPGLVGRLDCVLGAFPVLECAVVDLHAAKPASARRIASDREMCSSAHCWICSSLTMAKTA